MLDHLWAQPCKREIAGTRAVNGKDEVLGRKDEALHRVSYSKRRYWIRETFWKGHGW